MSEEYNGWTNYETWAVHLWLTGEERGVMYIRAIKKDIMRLDTPEHTKIYLFADHLKEIVVDWRGDYKASLFSDLLTHAIGRVNWDEIAKGLWEEDV